jgi:hypothetical protein
MTIFQLKSTYVKSPFLKILHLDKYYIIQLVLGIWYNDIETKAKYNIMVKYISMDRSKDNLKNNYLIFKNSCFISFLINISHLS